MIDWPWTDCFPSVSLFSLLPATGLRSLSAHFPPGEGHFVYYCIPAVSLPLPPSLSQMGSWASLLKTTTLVCVFIQVTELWVLCSPPVIPLFPTHPLVLRILSQNTSQVHLLLFSPTATSPVYAVITVHPDGHKPGQCLPLSFPLYLLTCRSQSILLKA